MGDNIEDVADQPAANHLPRQTISLAELKGIVPKHHRGDLALLRLILPLDEFLALGGTLFDDEDNIAVLSEQLTSPTLDRQCIDEPRCRGDAHVDDAEHPLATVNVESVTVDTVEVELLNRPFFGDFSGTTHGVTATRCH